MQHYWSRDNQTENICLDSQTFAVRCLLKCNQTVLIVVQRPLCLQSPHSVRCINKTRAENHIACTPNSCIIWNLLNYPMLHEAAGKQMQSVIIVLFSECQLVNDYSQF